MNDIKIRQAPSGKFYAVWHGHPICDEDDGLRYFDTEDTARGALTDCDLVVISSSAGEPQLRIKSPAERTVIATAAERRDIDVGGPRYGSPCFVS